ncbi:MAG: pseudouridine-5'-phosphate glycosidase, partial [Anaerolineae bacterium]|nr:pseudouridine-5'-phosphate glycosidase [Anaerolineae bacterium]
MKHPHINLSVEVTRALNIGAPVVALESTVITHGLPHPQNLSLARDMEKN